MRSTLSVVLSGYNEDGSIASILARALAARTRTFAQAGLAAVDRGDEAR